MGSTAKKILIILCILLILLVGGAYGFGSWYFSGHFLPGTFINNFSCSLMNEEETNGLLARSEAAYALAIQEKNNGQEGITASEMGLEYLPGTEVQQLLKEQPYFLWFLHLAEEYHYHVESALSIDDEKLGTAVSSLKCMQTENVTPMQNAYAKYNGQTYEIVPEVTGNQLDYEKTTQVIHEAALRGDKTVNLEESGCYVLPAVYQDDEKLISGVNARNAMLSVTITYDFADRKETVGHDMINEWFVTDENGDYTLDQGQVRIYVNSLAEKYDTVGNTREFRNYCGEMKTIEGGDYGWAIDVEAETSALIEAIRTGQTQVREPIYSSSGYCRDTNDIGLTYIDVDLTNQRLVLYVDGTPTVDTGIVSGNPNSNDCGTPTGCYSVKTKESPAVTICSDHLADISYWIPFCGTLAIHDASWRSDFGSGLYVWDGSLGCIDLAPSAAAALYSYVETNMPVIIYY